jgi:hypothetical protein
LKALWIRVGDYFVWNRKIRFDVCDLRRPSLLECHRETNIPHCFAIDEINNELQKLSLWLSIDLDAVECP